MVTVNAFSAERKVKIVYQAVVIKTLISEAKCSSHYFLFYSFKMNTTFDRSLIGLIKNETTFVQSDLNYKLNPTDQQASSSVTAFPSVVHICTCFSVVVVLFLIVIGAIYIAQRQNVTKRRYSKVIKLFFSFYINTR